MVNKSVNFWTNKTCKNVPRPKKRFSWAQAPARRSAARWLRPFARLYEETNHTMFPYFMFVFIFVFIFFCARRLRPFTRRLQKAHTFYLCLYLIYYVTLVKCRNHNVLIFIFFVFVLNIYECFFCFVLVFCFLLGSGKKLTKFPRKNKNKYKHTKSHKKHYRNHKKQIL